MVRRDSRAVADNQAPARGTKKEGFYCSSDESYRLFFLRAGNPLAVMDPAQALFIDCNDAAARIFGYPDRSWMTGRRLCDVSATIQYDGDDSLSAAVKHINRALSGGAHVFGWRHRRPDGEIWDAEVRLEACLVQDRKLLHVSLQDVTDSRRHASIMESRLLLTEYALSHTAEQVLQKTLDEAERLTGSRIGFFHFVGEDQNTIALQVWSSGTRQGLCAISPAQKHYDVDAAGVWVECIHRRRPVIHNDYLSLPGRGGLPPGHVPVQRELVVPVIRGNSIVAVLGVGNKPDEYGKADIATVSLLADFAWDISEAKRAEEALSQLFCETRASEERMSVILSSVTDGLFSLDADGRLSLINSAAERLLGVSSGEVIGKPAEEVIAPSELLACCLDLLSDTNAKERSIEVGLFSAALAENRCIQVHLAPLPVTDVGRGGIIAALFDVTREREIERLKNEFVNTAAHELRTPLTAVLGYAELLQMDESRSQFTALQRAEFISQILEKGEVLTHIVDDILDLGRLEAGRPLHLEMEPCRLPTLIRAIVEPYRRESPRHCFEFASDLPEVAVMVDKARISQVLDNLLTNAVKYSPRGGRIQMGWEIAAEEVVVSVVDDGIGMTPEQVERIFEKFFRVDNSTTAAGGLGLGMCIARGIVEAHGGRIWVQSTAGEGTAVRFVLPLHTA